MESTLVTQRRIGHGTARGTPPEPNGGRWHGMKHAELHQPRTKPPMPLPPPQVVQPTVRGLDNYPDFSADDCRRHAQAKGQGFRDVIGVVGMDHQ